MKSSAAVNYSANWRATAEKADRLCHKLVSVCPRKPALIPFKQLEVNRSEIQLTDRLGAGKFGEVWKGQYYTDEGRRIANDVITISYDIGLMIIMLLDTSHTLS